MKLEVTRQKPSTILITSLLLAFSGCNSNQDSPESNAQISKSSSVSSDINDRSIPARKVDMLLQNYIEAVNHWKSTLDSKPIPESLSNITQDVFNCFLNNANNNPLLNIEDVRTILQSNDPSRAHQIISDPNFYFIAPIDSQLQDFAIAYFNNDARTVYLPENVRKEDLYMFSVFFHEHLHILQEQHRLKTISTEQYLEMTKRCKELSTKPSLFIDDEIQAYGLQLELFNALLDQAFEKDWIEYDAHVFSDLLNIDKEDLTARATMARFCYLASLYFHECGRDSSNPKFTEAILNLHTESHSIFRLTGVRLEKYDLVNKYWLDVD